MVNCLICSENNILACLRASLKPWACPTNNPGGVQYLQPKGIEGKSTQQGWHEMMPPLLGWGRGAIAVGGAHPRLPIFHPDRVVGQWITRPSHRQITFSGRLAYPPKQGFLASRSDLSCVFTFFAHSGPNIAFGSRKA